MPRERSLNRLVTITGSSALINRQAIQFNFVDGYIRAGDPLAPQDTSADDVALLQYWWVSPRIAGANVSDLAAATHVNFTDSYTDVEGDINPLTQSGFQTPFNAQTPADRQVYVLTADGEIGATFNVGESVGLPRQRSKFIGWQVPVQSFVLNGPDFPIGTRLGFSTHVVNVRRSTDNLRKVWAKIDPQGTTAGLVRIDFEPRGDEQPFITGSQETALITCRYFPDIAAGIEIIDDQGGVWEVAGARPFEDRRFIEYEVFRTVRSEEDA